MMLKMLNPLGGMPAVPGGEEREESGLSREELQEQERLRKELFNTDKTTIQFWGKNLNFEFKQL